MIEKTACFTGHRKIPSEQYDYIARRLEEVEQLVESKIDTSFIEYNRVDKFETASKLDVGKQKLL